MKLRSIFFVGMLLVAMVAQAQQLQEVVYLKNGSIIRGVVIEQVPNESLKIQTADGSIFAYPMDEVEKITKEEYVMPQKEERTKTPREKKEQVVPEHYPIQIGVRVGMNFPNIKASYAGSEESGNGTQIGYHVGVIVDIPLYRNYFYVQPGLYLTQKGYKNWSDYYGEYDDRDCDSANPTYLEIPILLSGRYTFDFVQVQFNFGPYLACGLFGNMKETSGSHTYKYSYFGDDEYDESSMSRFDVGLSFGLGALFLKHYYIGFQYELGLYNALTNSHHSVSLKNQNWMLCLGYNF